jgi:hypothetical protein
LSSQPVLSRNPNLDTLPNNTGIKYDYQLFHLSLISPTTLKSHFDFFASVLQANIAAQDLRPHPSFPYLPHGGFTFGGMSVSIERKKNCGTGGNLFKTFFKDSDIWDQVKTEFDTQPGFKTSQSFNPSTLSSS